jgi:hypothetical protein
MAIKRKTAYDADDSTLYNVVRRRGAEAGNFSQASQKKRREMVSSLPVAVSGA